MSDPETQSQHLLEGRTDASPSTRPSRAYKVAGFTLLACVLIAGQAMIAYYLFSQSNDIKSLEQQSNKLKVDLTKGSAMGRSGSVSMPIQVNMPMKALPDQLESSVVEEPSAGAAVKRVPLQATDCQLEASSMKPVLVPDFRPTCDERGFYLAQQCFGDVCWCVNPVSGVEVPDTMGHGPQNCGAAIHAGSTLSLAELKA